MSKVERFLEKLRVVRRRKSVKEIVEGVQDEAKHVFTWGGLNYVEPRLGKAGELYGFRVHLTPYGKYSLEDLEDFIKLVETYINRTLSRAEATITYDSTSQEIIFTVSWYPPIE